MIEFLFQDEEEAKPSFAKEETQVEEKTVGGEEATGSREAENDITR